MPNVIEIIFKGVDNITKVTKGIDGSLGNLGKSITAVGGMATAGLTLPIVAFGKSAVDSAMAAESELAELEAVLKSTGGAAGLTSEELTKMASELQKVTKFSDEEVVAGQSMLLTFTKIGKDVFPQATEAMLDMAEKFGGVDAASVQLGKALNDPIEGVTALRRVGVALTAEQEEQIKKFMEVGDIASAQKVILAELGVEFGGLAKAAGETTAGKMAQLTNAFDDMKEVIGAALVPHLVKITEFLSKLVEGFMNLSPFTQKAIVAFLGIVAVVGPLLVIIGSVVSAIATLGPVLATIGGVITGTLIPAIGAVITALAPVLIPILAIVAVVGLLYLAWKNNFLGIQDITGNVVEAVKAFWVNTLLPALQSVWSFIQENILPIFRAIGEVISAVVNLAFRAWMGYVQNVTLPILKSFWDFISSKVMPIVQALAGWISDHLAPAFHGIASAISGAVEWLGRLADQINSLELPSWLTPGSPTPLELGLLGIKKAMADVAAVNPFLGSETGMGSPVLAGGGMAGGVVINVYYNPALSTASRAEVEQLMPLIREGTQRVLRDKGL